LVGPIYAEVRAALLSAFPILVARYIAAGNGSAVSKRSGRRSTISKYYQQNTHGVHSAGNVDETVSEMLRRLFSHDRPA